MVAVGSWQLLEAGRIWPTGSGKEAKPSEDYNKLRSPLLGIDICTVLSRVIIVQFMH